MQRIVIAERPGWKDAMKKDGCSYIEIEGKPYWAEGVCYQFTAEEIDAIETATKDLHDMCKALVEAVVESGEYEAWGYQFNDTAKSLIEKSWEHKHQGLIGRFDLGFNADREEIKLFEYNADTPTGLPEASIWQWKWLSDMKWEGADQFNSIHETLVDELGQQVMMNNNGSQKNVRLYFAASGESREEDWGNIAYLVECATIAGRDATEIQIDQVGYAGRSFTDQHNKEIPWLFKLYPWELMIQEEYASVIMSSSTYFCEPPWKMLLSNKMLLPALWKLYPEHPLLLESHAETTFVGPWIRKPALGREGANVTDAQFQICHQLTQKDMVADYDDGYVLQRKMDVTKFGPKLPVIGSWIIGEKAVGIGIREDDGFTTNESQFVPHFFR